MSDKELLEMAAKAAGVRLDDEHYWKDGFWTRWNPLTDDGDAFRLAVKLAISTRVYSTAQRPYREVIEVVAWKPSGGYGRVYDEPVAVNRLEATRRAIVRAAAAFGESMP